MIKRPTATSERQTQPTADHVDAINQVFTELELAYHNQFHRAFSDATQMAMAKQLWLHALCDLPAARLRAGVRRAIKQSEFLPNVHTLRRFCEPSPTELGVPDVRAAYIEACRAANPKQAQPWSHPIVYHAGRESDWFFLGSAPESVAFPVFKRNYELLLHRLLEGETLEQPLMKALPETIEQPLSREERKARMRALRDELNI